MITRKSANYATLFGIASDYLELEGEDRITNIDQYFGHIEQLAAAAADHPEFMRLPIDEPCFTIDLDTREIDIPTEFANGISVEGDQIAENIWFSVDRFFDQKDLLPTDENTNYHIIVQWTNAAGTEGLSETLWYNYKANNNQTLIFCWPITEAITAKAGTIQFSVRFYETKADNASIVIYNLNTQPCSVKILEGLDSSKNINDSRSYTLDRDAENYIISQLKNTADVGEYSAETPVFLEPTVPTAEPYTSAAINLSEDGTSTISYAYDTTNKVYVIEDLVEHTDAIDFYVALDEDLIADENDFNYQKSLLPSGDQKIYVYSGSFVEQAAFPTVGADESLPIFYIKKSSKNYVDLYIEAKSTDSGEINYYWENQGAVRDTSHESNAVYFKTNDSAPIADSIYYTKSGNTYSLWLHDSNTTEFPSGTVIYERYSQMMASVADTYYGMAKNTASGSTQSTGRARAKKFQIPGPSAPTLTVADAARQVVITYHVDAELNAIDDSVAAESQPGRLKAAEYIAKANKTDADHIYFFNTTTQAWNELTAAADWVAGKSYCRKYAVLAISATAGNAKDTLSYQWALNKAATGYGDTRRHIAVADADEASLITNTPNSLTDAGERYVVDVTSSRNNAELVTSSAEYRVTDLPSAPALTGDYYVLNSNGVPKWQRDEMENKVVTEQYKGTENEDFIYHGASSYVQVVGITSDVMKFKINASVADTVAHDDFYYEWHLKTDTTDSVIKQGQGADNSVIYFPKTSSDASVITSNQIAGTNIYCNVWTVLNGLGRPSVEDRDFPACGNAGDNKAYANIYGNLSSSAIFMVLRS